LGASKKNCWLHLSKIQFQKNCDLQKKVSNIFWQNQLEKVRHIIAIKDSYLNDMQIVIKTVLACWQKIVLESLPLPDQHCKLNNFLRT
jgi:hypothetical protein